jgi:GntR family transcriptional regulator
LAPGDRVPSVREIAGTWNIARATAEKALALLRSQGLITTRLGVGAVVREDAPIYRSTQDRHRHVEKTGRIYTAGEHAKIREAELVPAPEDVAHALGIQPGATALRRHRVTFLGDTPQSSSTSWFTADVARVAPLLLQRERILQGTARYLEECTGRSMGDKTDLISARLATAEEAAELGAPTPLALLETRHTVWDTSGVPFTYEIGLARPGHTTTYHHRSATR